MDPLPRKFEPPFDVCKGSSTIPRYILPESYENSCYVGSAGHVHENENFENLAEK